MRQSSKIELVGAAATDHGDLALDNEAGRGALHNKGADTLMSLPFAGTGHDDNEVGLRHAADPDFAAIDDPVVAVAHRARGHAGGITTGARFGNGNGGDRFAGGVGFEVALALLGAGDRQ